MVTVSRKRRFHVHRSPPGGIACELQPYNCYSSSLIVDDLGGFHGRPHFFAAEELHVLQTFGPPT